MTRQLNLIPDCEHSQAPSDYPDALLAPPTSLLVTLVRLYPSDTASLVLQSANLSSDDEKNILGLS